MIDREVVRAASPIDEVIAEITRQPIRHGNGAEVRCKCSWHEDTVPSLRINVAKGVWHCDPCGIGGDVFEFVQRLNGCSFKEALAFLAARAGISDRTDRVSIVETYDYVDTSGTLQYQTVRLDPKGFRQRRPDGNSGWIWNLKGVSPLLYRLRELQGQKIVVVTEGEKDVDRLRSAGIAATTNHGGAKKWTPSHAEQLVAAGVGTAIVIPDNDDVGQQHARIVASSCDAAGLATTVLSLPGLPPKGDVSDWLDGHTATELAALLEAAIDQTTSGAADGAAKEQVAASIETSAEPIDLGALLTALIAFVRRFVVMSPDQAVVVALWIAHTYVLDAFDVTPYLNVESATPRAGKTRLFEVLLLLVLNAWFTSRASVAALIRKLDIDKPTLLFDERDATFKGDPELAQTLRGVLNAGYKRGGTVSLCVGVGAAMMVKDFDAFGAKAIGGIGRLPDTVADRSIPIVLRRRIKQTEPIEKFKARVVSREAAALTSRLTIWAKAAVPQLRQDNSVEIDLDNDRAEEVWEPLLQIAALAGNEWLEKARRVATALSRTPACEDDAIGVQLLGDVREVFRREGNPEALATKELIAALVAMEERPWATWGKSEKPITPHALAKRLAEFEVVTAGEMWLNGKNVRGYRRAAFEDAWTRYCAHQVLEPYKPTQDGPQSAVTAAARPQGLADTASPDFVNNDARSSALALETPPEPQTVEEREVIDL